MFGRLSLQSGLPTTVVSGTPGLHHGTASGFDAVWVNVARLSKCAHFATTWVETDAVDIANLLRTRV